MIKVKYWLFPGLKLTESTYWIYFRSLYVCINVHNYVKCWRLIRFLENAFKFLSNATILSTKKLVVPMIIVSSVHLISFKLWYNDSPISLNIKYIRYTIYILHIIYVHCTVYIINTVNIKYIKHVSM